MSPWAPSIGPLQLHEAQYRAIWFSPPKPNSASVDFHLLSCRASNSNMAESTHNGTTNGAAAEAETEEEDYLGDLSRFLPLENSSSVNPLSKKISINRTQPVQSSKKQSKTLNWQERRRLEREQKQQEEDERTLANVEAPIPQSNIGFKLLKQMGYTPGSALGKEKSGRAEPVGFEIRRSRAGIGREDPHIEKRKKEEIVTEKKRRKEEVLMVEFGCRQKLQWRTRKVVVNFKKAKAALDQLENKEVVEPKKNEDEEGEQEEDEEEEITEEDLLDILMKLRDEHQYCLFCGCRYESMESLLANCPGTDEDDH